MAGFKDYKGTPFVPFILPIIPRGSPLSPGSKLLPEKIGKIPGRRDPATGLWAGVPWNIWTSTDKMLDTMSGWYADRPMETVAIRSDELVAVDMDSDNPLVAEIAEMTAIEKLGFTTRRVRDGTPKFLLCYRWKPGTPFIRKARDVVQDADGGLHPVEILARGEQWLMEGEHPSGNHYSWDHDTRPVDEGWEKMKQVTLDQVNAFRALLRERLLDAGFTPVKGRIGTGAGSSARSPRCRVIATSCGRATTTG